MDVLIGLLLTWLVEGAVREGPKLVKHLVSQPPSARAAEPVAPLQVAQVFDQNVAECGVERE